MHGPQDYGRRMPCGIARTKVVECHRLIWAAATQFFNEDVGSGVGAPIDREDDVAFAKTRILRFRQRRINRVAPEAIEERGARQRGAILLRVKVLPRAQDEVG